MEENNNLILSRVFTKKMLNTLMTKGHNETLSYCVKRYLKHPDDRDYRALISEIYAYMDSEYRNEYYYKNTMLNKLLIEKHSMKTTTALTELPIGKSKADFVMINGKGVVYEIKTELDNIERLNNQIEDYYKAFKFVYVVTCERHYDKVIDIVNENVGIIILTPNNRLRTMRTAKEKSSSLEYEAIFKILRKSEFEFIITETGNYLPDVSQFKYYSECQKVIQNIDIIKLQNEMLKRLKNRVILEIEEFKEIVPYELRFLVYFSKFRKKEYVSLNKALTFKYGGE